MAVCYLQLKVFFVKIICFVCGRAGHLRQIFNETLVGEEGTKALGKGLGWHPLSLGFSGRGLAPICYQPFFLYESR